MQIGVETAKAVDQRRIFVVDEDEITCAALQFMLHDEIETHELTSPEAAYEKGEGWLKPDLVLLGVSWVRQRGAALVAEFAGRFPGVRVLVVTAGEDQETALEALKAGAHGVLLKPLRIGAVRRQVDTALGRAGAAALIQLAL